MKRTGTIIVILFILALAVSIVVYSNTKYQGATIRIDAQSMERGVGTVSLDGTGQAGSTIRKFMINQYDGDEGVKKLYVVELPSVGLQKITIDPHVRKGGWRIDRIILTNDLIGYTWEENGACSQKPQTGAFAQEGPCSDQGPHAAFAEDNSIFITDIPYTGFITTRYNRVCYAIIAGLVILSGGGWLLWPFNGACQASLLHYGRKLAWPVVVLIYFRQLYIVWRYSLDMPTLDEWFSYFGNDGLINGITWKWLFGFHNEHQIVLTNLLAWVNYKLFGLNFVLQNILNYIMFGGLILSMVQFRSRVLGCSRFDMFPFFIIFMLSTIDYENHIWAFQSQFHLVLLFSVFMLYHAYPNELTVKSALLFCFFAVVAMYTFSAGVIFVAVNLFCMTVYTLLGITGNRIEKAAGRRYLLTLCGIGVTCLCIWFAGYGRFGNPHPKIFPFEIKFWDFFLNIVSLGFGYMDNEMVPGIVCLTLVVAPIVMLLVRQETRWQRSTWLLLSASLGVLMVLAAISMGRAWIYPAKTSRYSEIGLLLIPYTALGWWLSIREGTARIVVLSLLWLFCFISFLDDWSTNGYAMFRQFGLYNLQNIEAYYGGKMTDIFPEDASADALDRAKKLGVSFAGKFTAGR